MDQHLRFTHNAPARATLVQFVDRGDVIASAHIHEGDLPGEMRATISRQRPSRVTAYVLAVLRGAVEAAGVPAAA